MLMVAVVDDEKEIVEQLSGKISGHLFDMGIEFTIEKFSSGNDFLAQKDHEFDIIFLDIEMPGLNGIQTAKKLREANNKSIIIFCTNLVQYAINGYEVSALGYLLKPVEDYSLKMNLDKACRLLSIRQKQRMKLKTVHSQEFVTVADILFIEVQRHNLFFNVRKNGKTEVIKTRGSMQDIAERLKGAGFTRCSTCYLVNLNHILSLGNNMIKLPDSTLPVSRTYKEAFTEEFMKFLIENEVANI